MAVRFCVLSCILWLKSCFHQELTRLGLTEIVGLQGDLAVVEETVAKVHGSGLALLRDAVPLEDLHDGLEDNPQIFPKGDVPDVLQIVVQLLIPDHGLRPFACA